VDEQSERKEFVVLSPAIISAAIIVIYVLLSIKILREYGRGVFFRLGHVLPNPKGPGIILVLAPVDRLPRDQSASRCFGSEELPVCDLATGSDSVLGEAELDELLSERDKLKVRLQTILDQHTSACGVRSRWWK
jgi:regulator of protease activity HflC (stomatin/prohibitin superfamily)